MYSRYFNKNNFINTLSYCYRIVNYFNNLIRYKITIFIRLCTINTFKKKTQYRFYTKKTKSIC